jgi:membrane associated rhomboid family serine protease
MSNRSSEYGGGGGRRFGGGGGSMTLGFPPFTRAIKWLVIINAAIYLLMLVLGATARGLATDIVAYGALTPFDVLQRGFIWQLVTYLFIHGGLFHILFNMLALWMFGSALETAWGDKQFLEFYFFCGIGAALITIGVAYATALQPLSFIALRPWTATIGASGAVFGVMMAFAIYYGDQEFMMFPLPFMIRAKYLVGILIFISIAYALGAGGAQGVAEFAHLGGALLGWVYVRFMPRKGLRFMFSERYYGVRNSYYKWKRRRAARKFEVYMRKTDKNQYFDEYGNYKPPDDKGNGESKGPWVN